MTKEDKEILKEVAEHLNYCGWGDSWEREGATARKLPERFEALLARHGVEVES